LKTQVKKDKKTPSAQGRRRQVAMVAVNSVLFNKLYFITSYENSEELYLLPPTATKPTVCSGGGYDDKHRRAKNTSSALLDSDNSAVIFSEVISYAEK
jgi:hypothetical protein